MSKFKIELTEQEVNTVLTVLGAQPYKDVAPTIATIFTQAQAQARVKATGLQDKKVVVDDGN